LIYFTKVKYIDTKQSKKRNNYHQNHIFLLNWKQILMNHSIKCLF